MTSRNEPRATSSRPFAPVAVVVIVALLLAGAAVVQAAREQAYPVPEIVDTSLYLTSGVAARRMTVSLNALAADLYWIRTLQYYGGAKRRLSAASLVPEPPPLLAASSDYDQLYPLLDLTTSLDPKFAVAYRFGAVFLAEAYPSGLGRPDLAIELLEKGIREQPDKWEYMEDLGFVHYWYQHDYRQAAQWFEKAGQSPKAPVWLKPLAATTLAQGGDRRSSRIMWGAILQSAEQDWLRRSAEHRLLQLRALDEIDELQKMVDGYVERTGESPADWQPLIRARAVRGFPVDPAGAPYEIGDDGKVRLSPRSPLLPLPSEPAGTAVPPS
jgi:tetratricopeptide (TPR) repeat protein